MADKPMTVMSNTNPYSTAHMGSQLFQAAVAAAQDYFITY